jgi:hypothetical protein
MSTLLYPLFTFVLLVVCVAYWGMTSLYPLAHHTWGFHFQCFLMHKLTGYFHCLFCHVCFSQGLEQNRKREKNNIFRGTERESGTKVIYTVLEQNRYFKSMGTG